MNTKRIQIPYLHILRIVAMLMVIMLHCVSPYVTNPAYYGTKSWYIYLFINAVTRGGVPIFFMISGYLLLSDTSSINFKVFYRKRLPRILIPLVCWNIFYYIFYCALNGHSFDISVFFAQLLDCGSAYHLWYIYTLSGIYLTVPFIKRIVDSCSTKQLVWLIILCCLCPTIRSFINIVSPVYVYIFDPLSNGYLGYFLLGYILGKSRLTSKQTLIFVLLGIAALIACAVGNHTASSAEAIDFPFNSGFCIYFYAIGAAFFCIIKASFRIRSAWLEAVIKHLSDSTFGMYLTHVAVIEIVKNYFMIDASPVISTAYLFVLTVPCSYLLSYLAGKIRYLT